MMAERGLSLAHTTILRWVQRYTPEFVKRWNRFSTPTRQSWRVDETYLKIRGKWVYLFYEQKVVKAFHKLTVALESSVKVLPGLRAEAP
jgi:transposase-like protein